MYGKDKTKNCAVLKRNIKTTYSNPRNVQLSGDNLKIFTEQAFCARPPLTQICTFYEQSYNYFCL